MDRERPEARPTPADLPVATVGTSARQPVVPVAERAQERVRLVVPDGTERPVTDVAQRVALPELGGVDVALVVYVGDALAGRVAAVDPEVLVDALGAGLTEVLPGVLDQVAGVGVVADEQRLYLLASVVVRPGRLTDAPDGFPAFLGREVRVQDLGSPAAVVEVLEATPVEADVGQQIDDALQVGRVVLGDRVP